MSLITSESLDLASKRDLETLILFDDHGLLIGPGESLPNYTKRLANLNKNFAELEKELDEKGEIELIGTNLKKSDKIPRAVFQSAEKITRNLYDFDIDWVPGFFTNSKMGILFAGCAMYSYEDFFAIFIIRKAFKFKERWIIYSRTELMAHELCHIAHIGFDTRNYEEIFAYQTSESMFRKILGGMLRTTADTYLILSGVVLLLVSQIVNVLTRPPAHWQDFPMPLIYGIALLTVTFVFSRYLYYWTRFRKARKNLSNVFPHNSLMPILFRCSHEEIKNIAKLKSETDLNKWVEKKKKNSLRWEIILKKYSPSKTRD